MRNMSSLFQSEKLEILFDRATMQERLQELADEVCQDHATIEKPLVVIGVLKGAALIMSDLVRMLDRPVEMDFIRCASYHGGTESSGEIELLLDVSMDLRGRHVLVVEDIIDTGLTIKFVLEHLESKGAESVKLLSLLEKPTKNTSGVHGDYVGYEINDHFVVGYGLDLKEELRNLPFVGVCKDTSVVG